MINALCTAFLPAIGSKYYFTHYDITNGLSQNTVHKILQDRQGFMWFGTKDGLNRFDGSRFRRIEIAEDEGSVSYISTIFEDSHGKLWIGTHKGACIYDPEKEKLNWFDLKDNEGKALRNMVTDFKESPDGRIFISSENDGIFVYNYDTKEFKRVFTNSNAGISSITQLCFCQDGRLYVGTFGDGLYFTDNEFQTLHPVTNSKGNPYFSNAVINALSFHKRKIYVATDNMGLHIINESHEASPLFVKDENGEIPYMRALNFDNKSQIFIGTESGLFVYDLVLKKITNHLRHDYFDRYSLSDDAVYSVISDREGGLWIGSYFGGIDYKGVGNPEFVKFIKTGKDGSLKSERIRELCMDNDGNIYVGSEDAGLSLYDPNTETFSRIQGITEKNIHGLCIDQDNLWIGTFSEGLIIMDLKTKKLKRIRVGQKEKLKSDFVFSVCKTKNGDIYIGTFSGLALYDRENDLFIDIEELQGNFIYNITEDSQGNLWVSTYSNGLFLKRAGGKKWQKFNENPQNKNSIPSNKIYSVVEDNLHNIWVLTQNGACKYNNNGTFDTTFLGVDKIQGVVYRIIQDDENRYWLTSNNGLYCIDPIKDDIWTFTTREGLPTNQFNYNSSLKSPDGKIYFGSIGGLVVFEPLKFQPDRMEAMKPVVTEFYVNSEIMTPGTENSVLKKSISMTDRIELEPWQNTIAFNFASFNYSVTSGKHIKYRLKGYDEGWHYADIHDALIKYVNLPSGDYKLQAAVWSSDEDTSGPLLDLAVIVNVPLYKRWWAILGYILLLLFIVGFIYITYKRYNRLSNERYIEKYKHEKERELFDTQIKFFTNVAHEIRTPLSLIKAPLDSTAHNNVLDKYPEIKENLDVINLNVDRLLYLADQLLDFRKIESGNYKFEPTECNITQLLEQTLKHFRPTIEKLGMNLQVNLPEKELIGCVDIDALSKIFSNLISNAVKYGSSFIGINLEESNGNFVLKISNDGHIITPENREKIFGLFTRLDEEIPGTGIGLSYARSLANLHQGSLCMDDDDHENMFILTIPLNCQKKENKEGDIIQTDLDIISQASSETFNALIVEDNRELLSFLQKKLTERNYNVFTAVNGLDALTILKEQYIDIVITDIMMPKMDGYELLSHIKEDVRYSHIPVILLTAKTRMEEKLMGFEAGADLYIEKPFSMEYLIVSIESLLRNRERIRIRLESVPLEKIPEKELSKADEEFLKKINTEIHENFSNPDFSVEEIVEKLGMSSSTFYRKVKSLLNLNPNEYIKLERLKKSAAYFKEGKTSISEVCYLVGFSSPGYFTKCFQKQFGISPKEYINKIKSSDN